MNPDEKTKMAAIREQNDRIKNKILAEFNDDPMELFEWLEEIDKILPKTGVSGEQCILVPVGIWARIHGLATYLSNGFMMHEIEEMTEGQD